MRYAVAMVPFYLAEIPMIGLLKIVAIAAIVVLYWAISRLPPEPRTEGEALDSLVNRYRRRLTGKWVLLVTLVIILLSSIYPTLGLSDHVFVTIVCFLWLALILIPAWLGYKRFGVNRWRLTAVLVILSAAGGALGWAVSAIMATRTWAEIPMSEAPKTLALAALVGLSVAAVTTTISRVRIREANLRNERLAADNERERSARQTVQAELKLLQAQVEPHFLFNTLANVRHLVHTGSPESVRMLDHLITYLRTALPDIRSESSTLGREAELARAYLEIMKMRMGGELEFIIDVAPELASHSMPPLMLMTLVENAVKHGVVPVGRGSVRIVASRSANGFIAEVIDDGGGLGGTLGQGLGLTNVRERLRALYGDRARLVLESGEIGGTMARLEIPA